MEQSGGEEILVVIQSNESIQTKTQSNFFICGGACQGTFSDLTNFLLHKQNCNKMIVEDNFEEVSAIEVIETPIKNPVTLHRLTCQYCDKTFKKKFDLTQHMRIHTGIKPHHCTICSKQFSQRSNLTRHLKTHQIHSKKLNIVTEKVDFQVITDNGRNIAIQSFKRIKCRNCTEEFSSFSDFKSHTVSKHSTETIFKCTLCQENDMIFDNLNDYTDHLKILHEEVPKPFCGICQIEFSKNEQLTDHLNKINHKVSCDRCGQLFALEKYLKRHKKSCQLKEKSLTCSICTKKFMDETNLRRHLLTHGSSENFNCEFCHKKFNRKDNLHRHKKVHMDSTKSYKCPFASINGCSKEFFRYDKLKDHLQSHGK